MSIHIGKTIHEIIQKRGIKVAAIANAVGISESSVYKVYNRPTLEVDQLLAFSHFLNVNLFLPYLERLPDNANSDIETEQLRRTIKDLRDDVRQREQRIFELERLIRSHEKTISLLEQLNRRGKKK